MWLFGGRGDMIPGAVKERLERDTLAVSPLVRLELSYLHEIGRFRYTAEQVFRELTPQLDLVFVDESFAQLCQTAVTLTWTRDPFDRLLAAHAVVADFPLITYDAHIREHLPLAWWG